MTPDQLMALKGRPSAAPGRTGGSGSYPSCHVAPRTNFLVEAFDFFWLRARLIAEALLARLLRALARGGG